MNDIAGLTRAVPIEMRDGTWLSGDLVLPRGAGAGSRRPTILIKHPYESDFAVKSTLYKDLLSRLVHSGYALIIVNDRGRSGPKELPLAAWVEK